MTQPPSLVFMCDLPLPLALSLIPPLSLRSHIAVPLSVPLLDKQRLVHL